MATDKQSRTASSQLAANEQEVSAPALLAAALPWYQRRGFACAVCSPTMRRTTNRDFSRGSCLQHGIKRIRIRNYTPRTTRKAERFS
jgi:hypothetical protein